MECVLAKNGNNSSLHHSLKQYLNTAQNDVRFSDNMALKGWVRGNSETMVAEFPDMPRDPNGEPIVFFYNQNTTSGLGNITMKLDLIRDQIEQWKPVFLKSQKIVSLDEDLGDDEKKLIRLAMWSSEPIPFDPMEIALHHAYKKNSVV